MQVLVAATACQAPEDRSQMVDEGTDASEDPASAVSSKSVAPKASVGLSAKGNCVCMCVLGVCKCLCVCVHLCVRVCFYVYGSFVGFRLCLCAYASSSKITVYNANIVSRHKNIAANSTPLDVNKYLTGCRLN
jgi:hypothetical protein